MSAEAAMVDRIPGSGFDTVRYEGSFMKSGSSRTSWNWVAG